MAGKVKVVQFLNIFRDVDTNTKLNMEDFNSRLDNYRVK